MRFCWTDDNVERLRALVADPTYHSTSEIAQLIGAPTSASIRAKMFRLGLAIDGAEIFWTAERQDRLKALVNDGLTDSEIAVELGASSRAAVSQQLRVVGSIREPWWNAARLQTVRDMADAKHTAEEVAQRLGTTRKAVVNQASRLKIKFNGRTYSATPRASPEPVLWTEARVEMAKTMWAAGEPAHAIAEALACGVTKSAVTSKLNRLGLVGGSFGASRNRRLSEPKAPKPSRAAAPRSAATRTAAPAEVVPIYRPRKRAADESSKVLADLDTDECRFPVGDDPGPGNMDRQFFCAAPRAHDQVYCTDCCREAYRTPEKAAAQSASAARAREALQGRRRWAA